MRSTKPLVSITAFGATVPKNHQNWSLVSPPTRTADAPAP
jgi:hypothetical protein